jgi:hypothetical protein
VQNGDGENLALKVVALHQFKEHERAVYMEEIGLLQKLQGRPHIIQMYDYEVTAQLTVATHLLLQWGMHAHPRCRHQLQRHALAVWRASRRIARGMCGVA